MTDAERISRILAAVADPADRDWLIERLEPPWRRRQRRLAARDALICQLGGAHILLGSGRLIAQAVRSELMRRSSQSALRVIELSTGHRVPSLSVIRAALAGQNSPLDSGQDLPDTSDRHRAATAAGREPTADAGLPASRRAVP